MSHLQTPNTVPRKLEGCRTLKWLVCFAMPFSKHPCSLPNTEEVSSMEQRPAATLELGDGGICLLFPQSHLP